MTAPNCATSSERGTKPGIPNRSNRKQPFGFSKRLYKLRWRIEIAFNRIFGATVTTGSLETILLLFVSLPLLYGRFNKFEAWAVSVAVRHSNNEVALTG
jgi:hypothetical protein